MPSHSNQDIQKHIDDNSTLISKMNALTGQLQTALLSDFEADTGVPIPPVVEAEVRELEYSMVYSTDPIIDEYMNGAKTLLDGVFSQNWPDVADKALDVVQVLMNKVIGSSSIQVGASSQSMIIPAEGSHGRLVCAAFTEVEECSSQDWLTATNFYVAYYAFVVWEPPAEHLSIIESRLAAT